MVLAVGGATTLAPACSDELRAVNLGEREVPPSFGGSDAGEDANDGDARAVEALCVATECVAPYATCGDSHLCGTNLASDKDNCGSCGHICGYHSALGIFGRCANGRCHYECADSDHRDCNGVLDDGCEIDVSADVENCGDCGKRCAAGLPCLRGKCGCPSAKTYCHDRCVDLQNDVENCGACGSACPDWQIEGWPEPPNNMVYGCKSARCKSLACRAPYADCDGIASNGCESDLASDVANCGGCGLACAPGQICDIPADKNTNTPECMCDPGLTLCGDRGHTCRDLLSDPEACGACDNTCGLLEAPHMHGECVSGRCEARCASGYFDCDGDERNGCEVNLLADGLNCGACGHRCETDAGQPCVEGTCMMQPCNPDSGTTR